MKQEEGSEEDKVDFDKNGLMGNLNLKLTKN